MTGRWIFSIQYLTLMTMSSINVNSKLKFNVLFVHLGVGDKHCLHPTCDISSSFNFALLNWRMENSI